MKMKCLVCGDEFYHDNLCPKCHGMTKSNSLHDDVTSDGGVHAHIEGRYDLVPPEAIRAIALVMEEGVKAGRANDNWRKIPLDSQLNHALAHLVAVMMGKTDEDHLSHALTRLAMAVAVRKEIK